MLKYIEKILNHFSPCFSRKKSFHWFVIIIVGLMIRSDHLGITSIVRDLVLNTKCYETMLHFFRSSSWTLAGIKSKWCEIVATFAPIHREGEYCILLGDGVKQAKDAKKMPCIKKLFQESENSKKPEYIFGHMFGGIGILIGNWTKWFCLPLHINLQDGINTIKAWEEEETKVESHVVQMITNAYEATKTFGKSILLLDRYFLSVPALKKLEECNAGKEEEMQIVTKAKSSCIAYQRPVKEKIGRGRPKKKGTPVKLKELFTSELSNFTNAKVAMYEKEEKISYYCINLLWGQKLYKELRFVLVDYQGKKSILVSTDLTLDPVSIIRLYSYRFKIECTFRELKQVIGGFSYQFWSKSMPKLKRYSKKNEKQGIEYITNKKEQEKITETVKAIEGYVQFSCIAIGILQMISLKFSKDMNKSIRYMRTPSKSIVSEATVSDYLSRNIYRFMSNRPQSFISKIIKSKQKEPANHTNLKAS